LEEELLESEKISSEPVKCFPARCLRPFTGVIGAECGILLFLVFVDFRVPEGRLISERSLSELSSSLASLLLPPSLSLPSLLVSLIALLSPSTAFRISLFPILGDFGAGI
jgi:hypothetical protein